MQQRFSDLLHKLLEDPPHLSQNLHQFQVLQQIQNILIWNLNIFISKIKFMYSAFHGHFTHCRAAGGSAGHCSRSSFRFIRLCTQVVCQFNITVLQILKCRISLWIQYVISNAALAFVCVIIWSSPKTAMQYFVNDPVM